MTPLWSKITHAAAAAAHNTNDTNFFFESLNDKESISCVIWYVKSYFIMQHKITQEEEEITKWQSGTVVLRNSYYSLNIYLVGTATYC